VVPERSDSKFRKKRTNKQYIHKVAKLQPTGICLHDCSELVSPTPVSNVTIICFFESVVINTTMTGRRTFLVGGGCTAFIKVSCVHSLRLRILTF
jgi:hypothetical protein